MSLQTMKSRGAQSPHELQELYDMTGYYQGRSATNGHKGDWHALSRICTIYLMGHSDWWYVLKDVFSLTLIIQNLLYEA